MNFFRAVAAFAVVATLVQLALVTLLSAHFLTLDGNTLRVVAFVIALLLAVLIPGALVGGSIRALENRGRSPRRGPMAAGMFAVINGLAVTGLLWGVQAPVSAMWSGGTRLVTFTETAEVTEPTPEGTPPVPKEAPAPKGSDAIEGARAAVMSVLAGDHPEELTAGLSDESAAALGTLWMAFLSERFDDLEAKAGPELWAAVHTGLPDQPDLWSDPAALEADLVPRGRAFLGSVVKVADAAVEGHGTGPLTWPVLPESVVTALIEKGDDVGRSAPYSEVAMNRVEVRIGDTTYNVRYEDHGWRVHLGDYGDIATRRISPRALMIALRP